MSVSAVKHPQSSLTPRQLYRARLLDTLRVHLGPRLCDALEQPDLTDLVVNADGQVWVHEHSTAWSPLRARLPADTVESIISTVASIAGAVVNAEQPELEAEFPLDGSRFTATLAPVSHAAPVLAIRRLCERVFTLDEYVAAGRLTNEAAQYLREVVRAKQNILIAGAMGSGKTTLGNALLHELEVAPDAARERVIIIEDTVELRCEVPNRVAFRTSARFSLHDALRMALRYAGTRIIVGEVRGAEAHDLLKAMNTGHPGAITTLHANSAEEALDRLGDLVAEANVPINRRLIARAINVIVYMTRTPSGPSVGEVVRVTGCTDTGWSFDRPAFSF